MKENKIKTYPRYQKINFYSVFNVSKFLLFVSFISLLFAKRSSMDEVIKGNLLLWIAAFIDSFYPNIERFVLKEDSFFVKKLFIRKSIPIPNQINLVITQATAVYLLKGNTVYDSQILKDCYMVCVVDYVPLEDFQKILGMSRYRRKTRYRDDALKIILWNNTYCKFLYSFTYDQNVINQLIREHKCRIIIPKSLQNKVPVEVFSTEVCVDEDH